ncbi:hypothetical protein NFI96_011063 [Prochilodus magdalenae]|nr:hypothetical protein NFI96_011063 [Prochilodus magdalenae]
MGKSKEISQDIRKRIVDLHKSGSSLVAISRCLKVPRSSVQNNYTLSNKKDGNVQPSYCSGRKKVLCPRDERAFGSKCAYQPRAKSKKTLWDMMAEGWEKDLHFLENMSCGLTKPKLNCLAIMTIVPFGGKRGSLQT